MTEEIIETKLEYQIKASKKSDSKAKTDSVAIFSDKGIPMMDTTNGKTYLVQITNGALVANEVTE